MKNNKFKEWILQPQEVEGTYTFSGKVYLTKRISNELSETELKEIFLTIREEIYKKEGLDYLLVLKNSLGKKIFIIDNLNKEMKEKSDIELLLDNNYFTVLFAEEY